MKINSVMSAHNHAVAYNRDLSIYSGGKRARAAGLSRSPPFTNAEAIKYWLAGYDGILFKLVL